MTPERPEASASGRVRFGGVLGKLARGRDVEDGMRKPGHSKWSMGVLNDPTTVEVPGSVLLLAAHRNEPLGLRNVHARTSHSSIPAGFPVDMPMTPGGTRPLHEPESDSVTAAEQSRSNSTLAHRPPVDQSEDKKKTSDGAIILEPQPDDSTNDPLNWPSLQRDFTLISLGLYCMIGGGITPLLAAGFTDVADEYDVHVEEVALTTGLYMMGLGIGSVFASPTAILYGKRPVYLVSSLIFIATSLWCAASPSFNSLLVARVFQGMAISPVECLPSATIAEIFFLHERAYRIGIYTLLLLSGKNLVPLVSAVIIGSYGWRWVFWIVAMVGGLGFLLLLLFVPETFWDRTPTRKPSKRPSFLRRLSSRHNNHSRSHGALATGASGTEQPLSPGAQARQKALHVGFAPDTATPQDDEKAAIAETVPGGPTPAHLAGGHPPKNSQGGFSAPDPEKQHSIDDPDVKEKDDHHPTFAGETHIAGQPIPTIHLPEDAADFSRPHSPHARSSVGSPYYNSAAASERNVDYFAQGPNLDNDSIPASSLRAQPKVQAYTHNLRQQPTKSFKQQLTLWNGRLNNDKWIKVAMRPFILFAYPAVLWSSVVYACSIGWLIVVSELLAVIYRDPDSYNFSALSTGLVYISPFVGGVLGTGVAGKISDIIVKSMSRRNGGLYEPEFRLVMAIPILLTTCIGLMGFGWSAQERDHWIVPTFFFGIISFGCSLGSTTSITFCVDSYRQYAGEALVTLNFTKNICHGLVFSLFVSHWLADDGPKMVFIWIGIIQLVVLLFTIPMYIYGKRARMWTNRKNLMEKF